MVTIRIVEGAGRPGDGERRAVRLRRAELVELPALLARSDVRCWVDLDRPQPAELDEVARLFGFHPLAVEDCRAPSHLPKVEAYDGYLFLIVHVIDPESVERQVTTTDLECFLAERYLVTHHVRPHAVLDHLASRLEADPHLLADGADRLLHELLDAIVDRYFPAVEAMQTRAEALEAAVFDAARREDPLPRLLALKAEVTQLKRAVVPELEVLRRLAGQAVAVVSPQGAFYFRDVLDHLERIEAEVENLRDELTTLVQVHLGVVTYRLDEAIRILTVFSVLLLPLHLIAGIYGMNFQYMPELGWRYGYPFALGLMALVAAGLLLYFRRRGLL
ncbi:MAG TPA: magnesium/cobalt transporter CorA [Thermodesulfobacteriota bacterium]|nr:magnesium/cobalt transporter CorA [Thermodesulfobacteriota bacterium]